MASPASAFARSATFSVRKIALLFSTVLASGLAAPVFGQTVQAPTPETFRNNDEHGVDLVTGTYNVEVPEGDIGQGNNRITLVRYAGQSGYRDNWSGDLRKTASGITITFGKVAERFTLQSGAWVPVKANGATLVENTPDSVFTYRAADGTKIVYTAPALLASGDPYPVEMPGAYCSPTNSTACAVPTAVVTPNNQTFALTWTVPEVCRWPANEPRTIDNQTCTLAYRLSEVRSNTAYVMKFKYQGNAVGNNTGIPSAWFRRATAKFIDLSQVYCDPAALDCDAVAGSWPTVTYSNPSSGVTNLTRETGSTYVLTTNPNGLLTGVRRPGATTDTTTIVRGTDGRVASLTENGETKNYIWTGTTTTTVTTTTSAGETAAVTSTPTAAQPTSVVNATANTTSYLYDAYGRKTRETRPEGDYTNWTYDARGNITETRRVAKAGSGLGDLVQTASFDATCTNLVTCNKPNYVIDPKGNRTDYTYDPVHGQVTRIQLPAPTVGGARPETNYVYSSLYPQLRDGAGNLVNAALPEYKVTQITACATAATCSGTINETKVTLTYANPNLLTSSITVASGNGTISATRTYAYDAADNLQSEDGPLPGTDDTTFYFYDANNRRRGVIGPDPDGAGPRPRVAQRFTYDAESRIIRVERGTATAATDAALTSMTATEFVDTAYDANGNVASETLKSGATSYALTQYGYDADNRLICTAIRMNPAAYGSLPTDACIASTLNATNGPDRIVKNSYDANGRATLVQTGFGQAEQANEVAATYTPNGKTATVKDGENNLTSYVFDGHDRLSQTRYPSITQGAGISNGSDFEQLSYDANSNVTQRRLRDGQLINLIYDNLNRLTTKDLPGTEPDATFGYDLLSRLTSATQNGQTLSQSYDALSRIVSVGGPLGTVSYLYDAASRRTRMTWPDALYVTYDYDFASNITAIRENGAASGVGVLASYSYDGVGRRTGIARGNGTSSSFVFDPVSRLSSLSQDLTGTAQDITIGSIAYNPASQIASQVRSNDSYAWSGHYNVNRNYAVNGLNQMSMAGSTALGYDLRGNLNASGAISYAYSSENLLKTGPSGATLDYDPALRLYQSVGGGITTRFLYDGSDLVAEFNGSGVLQRRYVHGPGSDEPIVWYEGVGTADRRWLHTDERGSVIATSNSAGAALAINRYDEYGIPASTNLGRFGYTGQTWLPEFGMWYYKARMFSPTLGRFMQTDPIGYGDGINWYNYVGSDPINSRDPSGLCGGEGSDAGDPCETTLVVTGKIERDVCGVRNCGGGAGDIIVTPSKVRGRLGGRGPQGEKKKDFCNSKMYGFGKGMDVAGLSISAPGAGLAVLGELVVPEGGGASGAIIAEIGGGFGTIGQASKDYAAGRPLGEITARAVGNLLLGKALIYGGKALSGLPGGSEAANTISSMIGEQYVKGLTDYLDPKWCGTD